MIRIDINGTIAAIATTPGESGIGIVRISGREALKVADKIFVAKNGKKPSEFKTYTVHYGWVVDRQPEIIDEAILTVMRAPRSYTKEDVVEINCHGGVLALHRALELALKKGCRLAEPGEFTKRAFLNGRIDLAQAEAVLDVIRAKTDSALRVGIEQLKGGLSEKLNKSRSTLLGLLSVLEANIDFPEEEIGAADLKQVTADLKRVNKEFSGMLASSKQGRILRDGIHAVICGKPNVGKSSLLNALLKKERSIVTHLPGTTRDTIEEIIDIKGIPFLIVDTAGIIEPRDLIEKKALERSRKHMGLADLVLIIFDGSRKLDCHDRALIGKLKKRQALAVINKMDLKQKIERAEIEKNFGHLIEISAKKLKNIELLEQEIAELVYGGRLNAHEPIAVSNLRHIKAIERAQKLIAEGMNSLDNGLPIEFIAQDLKEALGNIDGILGREFSEDLLEKIFSGFCIGK